MTEGLRMIKRKNGRKYTIRLDRSRIFLPSEWKLFYKNLKEYQRFTFNVLINTGARINEARHIKVSDINFEDKKIKLRVVKKRNNYSNGKIRVIPISSKFCKHLKKYIKDKNLKEDNYLKILSTPAANIAMKKTLKISNIKDYYMFSIHNIRKTLETWLLSLNLSELKILAHFGHNKITCLKHYVIADTLNKFEKNIIRLIIGNLYYCNGDIDFLYQKIKELEERLNNKH